MKPCTHRIVSTILEILFLFVAPIVVSLLCFAYAVRLVR